MSNSKKRRHHLDERNERNERNEQVELMNGIRKPMPPPTKVMGPKSDKPQRTHNWKDFLEDEDFEEGVEGI